MCRYTNQILRNVNNKSRREEFFHDAAWDEEVIVIVNSNQINQNIDKAIFRSRFEIWIRIEFSCDYSILRKLNEFHQLLQLRKIRLFFSQLSSIQRNKF
jgi:hypothetical protein